MPALYACCEHCEHDEDEPGFAPDQHVTPCAEGCNDQGRNRP